MSAEDLMGLDKVLAKALSVGDVWGIEAHELTTDGRPWMVKVHGGRRYGIGMHVDGRGATLDIACRDAMHQLERMAAE